jgi:hypothetical protein
MKTFKQFRQEINEARKNPDLNPKISAYEALLPYKDDPNIFISFSNGKIGIKPLAKYDTPLSIYAFPIKQSWTFYGVNKSKSLGSLPYGLLYNDIFIIKKKPGIKVLNLSTMDNGEYTRYCNELLYILKKDFKFATGKSSEAYSKLYRMCVLAGCFDLPEQGDFINVDSLQFPKYNKSSIEYNVFIKKVKELENICNHDFDVVDAVKNNITSLYKSNKSPGEKFYSLTKNIVFLYFDHTDKTNKFTTSKYDKQIFTTEDHIKRWRQLFVDLGVDLVIDEGDSIIHFNEPCQAFFVDKSKFEVIDTIKNKEYKNYKDITDPEEALGYLNYKVDTKAVNILPNDLKYIKRNYLELVVPVVNNINNKNEINKLITKHKEMHENV